jgi:hypothetical protein
MLLSLLQVVSKNSRKMRFIAAVAVLLLSAQLANAFVDLGKECPGNLLQNGGFEEPNTEEFKTQLPDPTSNSKWGWYEKIPGQ